MDFVGSVSIVNNIASNREKHALLTSLWRDSRLDPVTFGSKCCTILLCYFENVHVELRSLQMDKGQGRQFCETTFKGVTCQSSQHQWPKLVRRGMYETKGHNRPQSSEINVQIVFIIVYHGSSSIQASEHYFVESAVDDN
jgi:hypothetical protein